MTDNKKFFSALGILAAVVLAAIFASISYKKSFLSIEAEPTGARVAGQNPMAGQRLELSSPLEITFDRDMDPASGTFALLAEGQSVSGSGVWSTPRTFTFTPDEPLQPATVYAATFDENLRAKDGTSPAETIAVEFKTVEALSVAQTFPAQDTVDVDLGSSITVIFNHPVVALSIKEEQSKLPQPLKFTPDVKGKGEWVNSSVYVFEPEKNLKSGTNYKVSVDAGIVDTQNNALENSFIWQFTTRSPIIANFALKDGAQNPADEVKDVPLDQAFIVTFLQEMNPKSVEGSTSIINRETREEFPVKFSWDDKFTELTIAPDGKFALAGYYELLMAVDTQSADGGNLASGLDVRFVTLPLPAAINMYPAPFSQEPLYNSGITITFNTQMDFESMKDKIQISPALKGADNLYYNT
ncbi:MAG: Ig-like domain-containing protein, partial [Anaerolineales bacterium]|nr:Ig-like domain-containing protein [Anaerolineales bacterium]